MATVVWVGVFILLSFELFITLLLVLPLPRVVRRFLAKKIFTYHLAERLRYVVNFLLCALIVAVIDAINSLIHLTEKEEGSDKSSSSESDPRTGYLSSTMIKQRKFRAERNMYLASFALTLGFVIKRLIELMQEIVSREEEKDKLTERITELEKGSQKPQEEESTTTTTEYDDQDGVPMTDISSDPSSGTGKLRRRQRNTSEEPSFPDEEYSTINAAANEKYD